MTRAVKAKERDTAEGVKLFHSLWPLQRPALRVLGFVSMSVRSREWKWKLIRGAELFIQIKQGSFSG